MSRAAESTNRSMLRVRDTIDREYATGLDVAALARVAHLSPDHLIRTFRAVFGETPHRYLQRRRVERAMALLRTTDQPVIEVCLAVGFASLGTFGRTFRELVGESPGQWRARGAVPSAAGCFTMAWTRPGALTETSISEKRGRAVAT